MCSGAALPLSSFSFFGQFTSDFGLAMAGLVLSMLPIIILYLALQRQIPPQITFWRGICKKSKLFTETEGIPVILGAAVGDKKKRDAWKKFTHHASCMSGDGS
ncbi:MAG: hypothetical protein IPM39_10890 [Chloroflexi bacterium]|nr:hypothetical protein [Chloroflexota bacterium]